MRYTIVIFTEAADQMKRTFNCREQANAWALQMLDKLGSKFYARYYN